MGRQGTIKGPVIRNVNGILRLANEIQRVGRFLYPKWIHGLATNALEILASLR